MTHFSEVNPTIYAELQDLLKKREVIDGEMSHDEACAALEALPALEVIKQCECGQSECRTYYFAHAVQPSRIVEFKVTSGMATLELGQGRNILSFERLLR